MKGSFSDEREESESDIMKYFVLGFSSKESCKTEVYGGELSGENGGRVKKTE